MSNETNTIELQVDVRDAVLKTGELKEILDRLTQTGENIGTAISKAFKPLQTSFNNIQSAAKVINSTLSEMFESVMKVNTAAEAKSDKGSWFQGIADGYNGLVLLLDQIDKVDKNSGKIYKAFADPLTAPNASEFIKSMFPNTNDLFGSIEELMSGSVIPTIKNKFGEAIGVVSSNMTALTTPVMNVCSNISDLVGVKLSDVGTALQGTFGKIGDLFDGVSLGWGAAIAGIIALIVLLVQNWDGVQAVVVSSWEAIQAAVGTAAEWLNTNIIQPIIGFFTEAWNAVTAVFSAVGTWFNENVVQPIIGVFTPIAEWFGALFSSIWQTVSDQFHNIGVIISGCWELLKAVWGVASEWFNTNVIQPVAQFFSGLWTGVCTFATDAWNGIVGVFSTVASWFDTNVIQPVAGFFSGMWDGFVTAGTDAWNAVVTVFSAVAGFFGDIFSQAWSAVVGVFSIAGEIFNDIKDGILSVFITIVNGLITGINSVVKIPFDGINGAISIIRGISIFDIQPFGGLRTINVPRIPYLAKGAVLPANKPFMAVVGDQRHGTNVEAPLTTIQEAVALVMEEHISAMMAGFQALLEEQRATRRTIECIEVGDSVIGQAAERYNTKMAIVRGG